MKLLGEIMPNVGPSRITTSAKWFWSAIVVVVIAGVATVYATDGLKNLEDVMTDQPVKVSASESGDPWPAWVSDQTLEVGPALTSNYGFPGEDIAINTGRPGVDAIGPSYTSQITFDLTGDTNSALRVTRINAVIDQFTAPPSATFMYVVPQGDAVKGDIVFDFRQEPFDALTLDTMGSELYLDRHTVTIASDESVGFSAVAIAGENADIRFRIEVHFDNGAKAIVDNNGEPFRVVGFPSAPKKVYVPSMLDPASETGLYECKWQEGCQASYGSLLRDGFNFQ